MKKKTQRRSACTRGEPDGGSEQSGACLSREPMYVNVENVPFITEGHIAKASVIEALGSFQIMVQFDRRGTWLLEQYC